MSHTTEAGFVLGLPGVAGGFLVSDVAVNFVPDQLCSTAIGFVSDQLCSNEPVLVLTPLNKIAFVCGLRGCCAGI